MMPWATVTALVPVRLATAMVTRIKLAPLVARGSSSPPEGDGAQGHRLFGAVDDVGHVLEVHRLAG
jgi:hypothetical protein